jgi:hypothetical protein
VPVRARLANAGVLCVKIDITRIDEKEIKCLEEVHKKVESSKTTILLRRWFDPAFWVLCALGFLFAYGLARVILAPKARLWVLNRSRRRKGWLENEAMQRFGPAEAS